MATTQSNKKQFTNFYLTMLILSVVFIGFSLAPISEIIRSLNYYSIAPAYVILQVLNFGMTLISIIGLVFLFRKQKLGIIITLGSYAASLLITIVSCFFVDQMVAYASATLSAADIREAGGKAMLESIMAITFYAALIFGALFTITYSTLWYFAWRGQVKADNKLSNKSPQKSKD